jgi:histidyl-tRNA synthetase
VAADAEICAMLAEALEAVGIARGDYVVRVNNRKVLNGVMEVAGHPGPAGPEKFAHERGIVLRAIDKLDRLGRPACARSWARGARTRAATSPRARGFPPSRPSR